MKQISMAIWKLRLQTRKFLLLIREHPWLAIGIFIDLLVIVVVGIFAVSQLQKAPPNAIPLTLIAAAFTALITLLFGMERENQSAQDKALQEFLDQISALETYQDLRKASEDGYKRAVVRAKMKTLLRRLDSRRKGILLMFLHEAKLIKKKQYLLKGRSEKPEDEKKDKKKTPWYYPILSLENIDLSGAYLSHSIELVADDLSGVNLSNADLSGGSLYGVNLRKAALSGANLRNAKLRKAKGRTVSEPKVSEPKGTKPDEITEPGKRVGPPEELYKMDLTEADLTRADLTGADLTGADLHMARGLTQTQIEKAVGDETTKLPEGLEMPKSWLQSQVKQTDENE